MYNTYTQLVRIEYAYTFTTTLQKNGNGYKQTQLCTATLFCKNSINRSNGWTTKPQDASIEQFQYT